ncbi:heavy-metal-associated domain-containing protein [Sulfobacillus thermosulfidooxidans]|uniref:heavy-metal-associated domain-containing protein n=1 Tax=Sulfobacillus thermosulfidooxidans TaxID=28034 RepID=UPI0006B43397|nr:copper ion binding protein [Sulfobacillus thermosulfidooxidans]OLZ09581.1 heavy metal-binding domain-containing protein [Sulfobacillus thermosulfidooxidans]OLZ16113.1 heavy metal-binding domain-containing protein [Sulfobacillus thermosulfidooxidans]OLZ18039.1 heavy metal-binding domain-containing protein [Sulfobacillus thermosulfidooxidans]
MERVSLGVKGMTCNHCVMTVTNALKSVDGVKTASVSLDQELAKITYDESKTSLEQLKQAVIAAGYQVE